MINVSNTHVGMTGRIPTVQREVAHTIAAFKRYVVENGISDAEADKLVNESINMAAELDMEWSDDDEFEDKKPTLIFI